LERGNNYLIYTLKGTELQETTVCHAEENAYINEVCEDTFKHGKLSCNFNFSLSPIKQISFGLYDDQKTTLTGILDNPDFAVLVKKLFIRALSLQLRDVFYLRSDPPLKYFRPLIGDPTPKEMESMLKYHDDTWL
jgi:hypothetical protein